MECSISAADLLSWPNPVLELVGLALCDIGGQGKLCKKYKDCVVALRVWIRASLASPTWEIQSSKTGLGFGTSYHAVTRQGQFSCRQGTLDHHEEILYLCPQPSKRAVPQWGHLMLLRFTSWFLLHISTPFRFLFFPVHRRFQALERVIELVLDFSTGLWTPDLWFSLETNLRWLTNTFSSAKPSLFEF